MEHLAFEEIRRAVARGEELPETARFYARYAWHALRNIHRMYQDGEWTLERAGKEAERLRQDYIRRCSEEDTAFELIAYHRENVRRVGILRSGMDRGLSAGLPAEEILPVAVACVRAMTGEGRLRSDPAPWDGKGAMEDEVLPDRLHELRETV